MEKIFDKETFDKDNAKLKNGQNDSDLFGYMATLFDGAALAESSTVNDIVAGSVDIDLSDSTNINILAAEDFTIENMTGTKPGQTGSIVINQDVTGSRLLNLGTAYVTEGGIPITLTTTPDAVDILNYTVISDTFILIDPVLDIS